MYESSCSYQSALELKRGAASASAAAVAAVGAVGAVGAGCPSAAALTGVGVGIKSEEFATPPDWPAYRFCNPSTFEQLKQSVEKAKQALQDRSGFLGAGSAFSDLYSGVASSSRPQDSLQDITRTRDDTTIDIKRPHGIQIIIKGEAHTYWSESENTTDSNGKSTSTSVSYSANEEYFDVKFYLIGGDGGEITLPDGQHIYPFTCVLPPSLPSSFEGDHGYIRYTVKVTLVRPWKYDQSIKAAFTVISQLDLNTLPKVCEPATLTMEKYTHACCCFGSSGPLTVIIKVPYTGFVCGQAIPLTVEIDNATNTDVQNMVLKLMKSVTYRAHFPRTKTNTVKSKLVELRFGRFIAAKNSMTIQQYLTIPPIPPSNLTNCGIIDLDYEILAEVVVPGFHRNMYGNLPLTIGTIPIAQNSTVVNENKGENYQTILTSVSPTAPQMEYNIPPPTYEECEFGTKSIKDSSDSEYTRFNNNENYNPMYPVYKFNTPPRS